MTEEMDFDDHLLRARVFAKAVSKLMSDTDTNCRDDRDMLMAADLLMDQVIEHIESIDEIVMKEARERWGKAA